MTDSLEARRRFLLDFFARAPIVATLGIELAYDGEGRAVVRLPHDPRLDHTLGQLHGGMVGTIVDTAAWFSAAPHYGVWIVAAEYQVRLLEPVAGTEIRAIGEPARLGSRIAVVEVRVERPGGGLVAVGAGTYVATSEPLGLPPESAP